MAPPFALRTPDPRLSHQQDATGTCQTPTRRSVTRQGEWTQGQAPQPWALARPWALTRWELPLGPGDEGCRYRQHCLDGHHGRWDAQL